MTDHQRPVSTPASPTPTRPGRPAMTRRTLLRGFGALGLTGAAVGMSMRFAVPARAATAGGTLAIPTLLEPTTDSDGTKAYALGMETGTTEILSGISSSTCGFNQAFLGPVIKVSRGDSVRMDLTNNLDDVSTVHWHGAHIPPSVDGGPQNTIEAGATFSPSFEINQGACTLWFHPHALGTTSEQVARGLAGMLIVDDDTDGAAALPSDYGTDQFPLIVQSLPISSTGVIRFTTATELATSTSFPLLVNGANVGVAGTPTLEVTANRVRFHVLNASIADIITITRSDGASFTQVATDAALLSAPLSVTSLKLVGGERAEICVDVTSQDESVTLQATVTAGGARGGSGTSSILTLTSTATAVADDLPSSLNTFTALDVSSPSATRTIALSNSGNTMYINGVAGTTMTAMESSEIMTTLGATEVWTITNATGLIHSFHLHDVPFQVRSINGSAPTGAYAEWKDTILISPQSTNVIAMRFTDYADNTYGYMLHCHNTVHEDEGMMAMLMVMSS
ncbi:multicopper oxidase family protein [Actinoplanes regularis]|uniref:Multicopper oxidase CueO n=1 Tax=Actinoplanes regularis TaxID=52697 RepID=A0A238Z5H7_9ACTN|nr:multicopper oxidase domain-containing protein [Actinoplanes regularis]GIE85846.1 multicopper oxidase [Actinoplanes regularis]SNR78647.1 suppressor of ftsI/bilirubin oxidase [Actinoplanes regularis]